MLFCSRDDAERLFGLSGNDDARASGLRARFGVPVAVLTAGADGAVGCDADGCRAVPAVPVEVTVERFGSGDAFAGGFLAEYLRGASLDQSLRMGAAAGALKRTILGDMLVATRAEVEAVMAQEPRTAWR